jgi:hypothetical protein
MITFVRQDPIPRIAMTAMQYSHLEREGREKDRAEKDIVPPEDGAVVRVSGDRHSWCRANVLVETRH